MMPEETFLNQIVGSTWACLPEDLAFSTPDIGHFIDLFCSPVVRVLCVLDTGD